MRSNLGSNAVVVCVCLSLMLAAAAQDAPSANREQVRLSEILISTPRHDPSQVTEAKKRAQDLLARIRNGENFCAVAQANSGDPSSTHCGDLGCFSRGKLAPALESVAFSMKPGETSDVIRTKQGFIILKATDSSCEGSAPVEVLNVRVTTPELNRFVQNVMGRVRQEWYKSIPKSADVPQLKSGNVDVEFGIKRNGEVIDAHLSQSSGDILLDEAALRAIVNAAPFHAVPSSVEQDPIKLRFHFKYNPR